MFFFFRGVGDLCQAFIAISFPAVEIHIHYYSVVTEGIIWWEMHNVPEGTLDPVTTILGYAFWGEGFAEMHYSSTI